MVFRRKTGVVVSIPDWMWEINLTNIVSRTKRRKAKKISDYKQSKLGVHTTINGLGRVARLRKGLK